MNTSPSANLSFSGFRSICEIDPTSKKGTGAGGTHRAFRSNRSTSPGEPR